MAEWQLGRGSDIYGYAREGFDETFILEGPAGQDGNKKGGLTRLWESAPIVDRQTVRGELEKRDALLQKLDARIQELTKYVDDNQAMIDAAGGYDVVLKRVSKAGLVRTREDGSIEPTEKLRVEIEKKRRRKKA